MRIIFAKTKSFLIAYLHTMQALYAPLCHVPQSCFPESQVVHSTQLTLRQRIRHAAIAYIAPIYAIWRVIRQAIQTHKTN